jgi:hypothetical protein
MCNMECRACGFTGDDVQEFVSSDTPGERKCPQCGSDQCFVIDLENYAKGCAWCGAVQDCRKDCDKPVVSSDPNVNWANDRIQYPRLLAELYAMSGIDVLIRQVCTSMDLTPAQVEELFERAQRQWDQIKDRT